MRTKILITFFLITSLISCKKDDIETPIASSVELISEELLQSVAGEQIAEPIVVLVKDQNGNPIEGIKVFWVISEGSVSHDIIMTNIEGTASINWTLGPLEVQTLNITVYEKSDDEHISGSPIVVNAIATIPTVIDIDGNVYNTARIEDQIWIAENLRVTKYNDGTPITLVENTGDWASLSDSDKAYCFYDNIPNENESYGVLYTWAAAMNGETYSSNNPSGVQGVCPDGWHIPSSEEWKQLRDNLGGADIAGGKMKEEGTDNWHSPNTGATNESGFTALPVGSRYTNGNFFGTGDYSYFWSTTENCMPCGPSNWWLSKNDSNFYHGGSSYSNSGYSVRCVMDSE